MNARPAIDAIAAVYQFITDWWWCFLLGLAVVIGVAIAIQIVGARSERRARRGLCPKCGYDLSRGKSERCPECGAGP